MTLPKYEILEQPDEKSTARVLITEGKFEAFCYSYGTISISEAEDDTGDGVLTFQYDLIEAPEDYQVEDEDAEKIEFETLVGDILVDIVTKAANEEDGHRLDDSIKPDSQ